MTYPLTEKQKEIVDYAESHSYKETEEKFGIGHNQVKYLRGKRNRIEREKKALEGGSVQPAMAFARVECAERTVEVKIGGIAMSLSVSDLAEVIKRL